MSSTEPNIPVVAKKRGHNKNATAVPIPNCHVICPGSGVAHAQAFLRVFQGQSYKFTRCPIPECKVTQFFSGTHWDGPFGTTKEDILAFNPNALIL